MKIKAFSQEMRVPMDTIRYYEKLGLINPKRLDNGYRQYDKNCTAQLKMIVVLKYLGFSLEEIYQLTALKMEEVTPECNESAIFLFDKKIKQLTQKVEFYQKAIETLQMTADLMKDQQYENNKNEIEHSIEQLYEQLKEGE